MVEKKGIPKEIIDELDVRKEEKESPIEVTAIVEGHQVKLPVPAQLRIELQFKKGQKLKVTYDKNKRRLIYQR